MATNWAIETKTKSSTTDNWTIETKTKASTTDNWTVFDIGNIAIGPVWEAMDSSTEERWEDLIDHYWGWTKSWTFSGKAVTRDSD